MLNKSRDSRTSIGSFKGRDESLLDEDERKTLCCVKFFHFFNFALFAVIYGAFAFSFLRIMNIERPTCIAPKGEYLKNLNTGNIGIDEVGSIDVTWRFNFAMKWGFYTNLIFAVLWLLAGLTMLPIKVTDPRGLFFIGTQIWVGCLCLISPVPGVLLFMIPIFLFRYSGKFCSGKLLEETDG